MTPEERKAWGEKMKLARQKKELERAQQTASEQLTPETEDILFEKTDFQEPTQDLEEIRRQLKELKEDNTLLRAAMLNGQNSSTSIGVNKQGNLVGEVEKYAVDPSTYPDPTKRLADEPRLAPIAFKHNYVLDYDINISSYTTQSGVNMKEPKFTIRLSRAVYDDQGNHVQMTNPANNKLEDKYYIVKQLIFHEDPQAAIVIARENGVDIDEANQKRFLDEMRYLRVRDWLFDVFWPRPSSLPAGKKQEVIGNQLVDIYTKSSEEPSEIPFHQLNRKG